MVSMEWHLLQVKDGMMERIIGEKITYTKGKMTIGLYHNTSTIKEQHSQTQDVLADVQYYVQMVKMTLF